MSTNTESVEIEVKGHLVDSLILTKIFDNVMDLNGEFDVKEIDIGKKKDEQSYARILITGNGKEHLDTILESLYREGAVPIIRKEVLLQRSPKDCVMPENFYSTTNNHTQVFHHERWIQVENMMMDKCIVVKNNRAFLCTHT